MSTVTFNSQSNTNCSLVFNPTNGSVSTVNIGPIQFPFTFDPEQYGLGVNEINGTYTFTCGDCVYTRVVNEVFTTTTTTTAAPTTTTTTAAPTTTTTTTKEPTTTTSTTLPTLTCEDVNITLNNGNVGDVVTGSVDIGSIYQIVPSTYVAGTNNYSVAILVPSDYANAGEVIYECFTPAIGITTTTSTTTEAPTTTTTTTTLGGGGDVYKYYVTEFRQDTSGFCSSPGYTVSRPIYALNAPTVYSLLEKDVFTDSTLETELVGSGYVIVDGPYSLNETPTEFANTSTMPTPLIYLAISLSHVDENGEENCGNGSNPF